jgi:hypothetical protein
MSEKVQSIIESIKGLSLLEASELVKGLEETFGVSAAAASVAVAVLFLKAAALPAIDLVSARPFWQRIASRREDVCIAETHRSWRYGLNYYSVVPLPDCADQAKPLQIRQTAGRPAQLVTQTPAPADY